MLLSIALVVSVLRNMLHYALSVVALLAICTAWSTIMSTIMQAM